MASNKKNPSKHTKDQIDNFLFRNIIILLLEMNLLLIGKTYWQILKNAHSRIQLETQQTTTSRINKKSRNCLTLRTLHRKLLTEE